jgi:hypothetical protein
MSTKKEDKAEAVEAEKEAAEHAKEQKFSMKYVGTSDLQLGRLTAGTTYHIIQWIASSGQHVSALMFADDGALYVGTEMQNPAEWEVVKEHQKKKKKSEQDGEE